MAIFLLQLKIWPHHCVPRPRFPVKSGNFGDSATNKGQIAYFLLRMHKMATFLLPVKNLSSPSCSPTPISYTMREFRCGNFGDSWTFKAHIGFFVTAWVFRTSGSKWGFLGVGRYWPPMNSFLLLGVYTSVSNLVKIDEEMRPWECPQTDRHTHTRTDANDFIICPMLYAITMGQIISWPLMSLIVIASCVRVMWMGWVM